MKRTTIIPTLGLTVRAERSVLTDQNRDVISADVVDVTLLRTRLCTGVFHPLFSVHSVALAIYYHIKNR